MACKSVQLLILIVLTAACTRLSLPERSGELRQVTSQGSASISQLGVAQARQAAIEQAMAHASAQLKRQGGDTVVGDVKIVDEWQEADQFYVQAVAVVSEKSLCASPQRKKMVVTAFPLVNSDQLAGTESQDLFGGIPREIGNQLLQSGDFMVRNFSGVSLYARPDLAPEVMPNPSYAGSSITSVALQHDAQFVLSGVIRDFRIESTEYVRGSGLLAEIKSVVRDMVGRRSIGIDVYVHDGFSGALLFQHRYNDSVVGDVSLPSGYNVGSERFSQSPVGAKIENMISAATEDIHRALACYPYETRVQQIEANNMLIIAGGAQDRIKVGDRFSVHPANISAISLQAVPSASAGMLTITEVSANHAVGHFDGKVGSVRAGDWVKSFGLP